MTGARRDDSKSMNTGLQEEKHIFLSGVNCADGNGQTSNDERACPKLLRV